ncbi:PREDICTED: UPF0329 protein ECU05_1680/ECU11_0050-like [Vollenhovia emeryi]|uniref:UPF0329 protein ECU05_1680/ECU11_0050-like n=1 Tax=Vollenhovia emeryi TaxID=411798 RepID=UPI0005F43AC9|nr:PREDICTED: UPF0329 protein ECU05_1680/ECU11_0050-like [Vollenhovia emeryi]
MKIEETNKNKVAIEEMQEIGTGENKMIMLKCRSWEDKREIMTKRKDRKKKKEDKKEEAKESRRKRKKIQRERQEERKQKEQKADTMTVGFWNIAELMRKNEEFWKEIEKWDIIAMLETWVEQKDWVKLRRDYRITMYGNASQQRKKKRKEEQEEG